MHKESAMVPVRFRHGAVSLPALRFALWAGLACGLGACGGGEPMSEPVVFERLEFRGWIAPGNHVFRTAAEANAALAKAWADTPDIIYFGREKPDTAPMLPAVNYLERMVLGVSHGQGNVCQNLLVTRVMRSGQDLSVEYKVDPPYFSNVCGSPPPVPWNAFVAVPRVTGVVSFRLVEA